MATARSGSSIVNDDIVKLILKSVGFLSCIVGLVCYALSLSFKSLFGEWSPTKIVVYAILSLAIGIVVLLAGEHSVSNELMAKLKPYVEFVILMLTSLYSFFADQSMKGKPDILTVVSTGAFALTSLCLSLQIELGFQVGLFNFFLGCLTVQLMKIHFIFILVAAAFSCSLLFLRYCLESRRGRLSPDDVEAPFDFRKIMGIRDNDAKGASATGDEGRSEQRPSSMRSDSEPQPELGDSSDQRVIESQIDNANSSTAIQSRGSNQQRPSSMRSDSEPQPELGDSSDQRVIESQIDNANSSTAIQSGGSSQQIAEGNEGSASHGEGNGNEGGYGHAHAYQDPREHDTISGHLQIRNPPPPSRRQPPGLSHSQVRRRTVRQHASSPSLSQSQVSPPQPRGLSQQVRRRTLRQHPPLSQAQVPPPQQRGLS